MMKALNIFQISMLVITWISEIVLCGSIIIVFTIERKKNLQFGVSDKILLYSALTNLLIQCSAAIDDLVYIFWFYKVMSTQGPWLVFTLNLSFIYDNFWNTTWLSIHYCLKLVAPPHSVFSQMKKWLSDFILPLLIGTSVGMFLVNLPYIWTAKMEFSPNRTNIDSNQDVITHLEVPFSTCNIILGCGIPFMVILICIGLSVGALVRHMWRMRRSASQSSSSPQIQGHVRAATTMALQLFLSLLRYISVVGLFKSFSGSNAILNIISRDMILLNPIAQTLTLILGNPKLKNKLFGQQLKD